MLDRLSTMIHLTALVIIGFIMTGVGIVLAIGGRPEALVPLLLGVMAIFQVLSIIAAILRDLTRNG